MKQPDIQARKEYAGIVNNEATIVPIPGTRRSVRLRGMHPYTLERLTKVWIDRETATENIKTAGEVLKDLAKEPYFAFQEASLMILNNDIRIRLFHWIYWRYLAHKYTEEQMVPIIEEGKKKLPLMAHFATMVLTMDMRTDMMTMTKAEAEQYQAELLSVAKRPLSRIFQSMVVPEEGFSAGSETLDTVAS